MSNPFENWPSLNKKDTMYLNTIQQSDFKNHFKFFPKSYNQLDVEDINSKPKQKQFIRDSLGDNLIYNTHHYKEIRPGYVLSNKGIDKSTPNINKFNTKRSPFNPNEPNYKWKVE